MASEELTNYKTLMNKEYFGEHDLRPKEDLTVTIREIKSKKIAMGGGIEKESIVAYLKGQKPIILNATNLKSIEKLYGRFIEHWTDKQVTLYSSTAQLKGETVPCVRIRPFVQIAAKHPISGERLDKAIDTILAGKYTEEKLLAAYELTTEQSVHLVERLSAGVDA